MNIPTHRFHRWLDRQAEPWRLLLLILIVAWIIVVPKTLLAGWPAPAVSLAVVVAMLIDRVIYVNQRYGR